MKQVLSIILCCVLLVAMLCAPAAAEESGKTAAPRAVPIADQIEALREQHDASDLFNTIENKHTYSLIGRWIPHLLQRKSDGAFFDSEAVFTDVVSINSSGTMWIERADSPIETGISVLQCRNKSLYIRFVNPETGYKCTFQLYTKDPLDWWYCSTLVMDAEDYWVLFYNEYHYPGFTPGEEPDPAGFTPVASPEEILNISETWSLASGAVNGRALNHNDFDMPLIQRDTMMTISQEEGRLVFSGASALYGGTYLMLESTGINESGEITAMMRWPEDDDSQTIFGLYGEGEEVCLTMNRKNVTYVFEPVSGDPLAEYSDSETIKTVQYCLSIEGYDSGTPDGVAGKKTAAAISAYQADNGLTETGTVTEELLRSLRFKGWEI